MICLLNGIAEILKQLKSSSDVKRLIVGKLKYLYRANGIYDLNFSNTNKDIIFPFQKSSVKLHLSCYMEC